MTESIHGDFDDVPFEPADYGRIKVREYDGDVYLVTWDEAIGIDPKHATQLGFELIRKGKREGQE